MEADAVVVFLLKWKINMAQVLMTPFYCAPVSRHHRMDKIHDNQIEAKQKKKVSFQADKFDSARNSVWKINMCKSANC